MTAPMDDSDETAPDTAALADLIGQVADLVTRSLPDAEAVAVSVSGTRGDAPVLAVAGVDAGVADLESGQAALGEGPGVLATRLRAPVVSGDVTVDDRWPRFAVVAGERGVRSVLVAPLLVDDDAIGTLTCWSREPDAFDDRAMANVTVFVDWASASVRNVRVLERAQTLAQQLQSALVSRATIDQAIGILRSRTGGTADEAFVSLRDISQRENVKLAVIAERLVDEAVRRARARHAHG